MTIGIFERNILIVIYLYWKAPDELAVLLNKKSSAYKGIAENEIHERFGKDGFKLGSLDLLCISLKIKKLKGDEKKDKRTDATFRRAIMRLYSGEFIKDSHNQIDITEKGILAATDKCWLSTVIRENKTWLLSLIISVIALIVSIVSLVVKF
jgi:hypothetical protein